MIHLAALIAKKTQMPKVYIIILNWNGWRDTIECLESVFRLDYLNYRVIVCDNASADESIAYIAAWAEGELAAGCANRALQYLSTPPCPKPIPSLRVGPKDNISLASCSERLILVQADTNLGFAGGNNIGLRLALAAGDLDYVWLLNNDTVVDPSALTRMVERMEPRPDAGICGSTLRYYDRPQIVQALGGSGYTRGSARSGCIGV